MKVNDNFLYFTYNGVHSSEFDTFYVNNGEDISFPFSHNVSHKLVSPLNQDRSYWLGSNRGDKKFSMELAVKDKTFYDTEKIFEWLDPSEPGELIIDYRANYLYKVIIDKITDPKIIPRELPNGLIENILLFSITFTSINSHVAETVTPYQFTNADASREKYFYEPDYLFPIAYSKSGIYHFINWSSQPQQLDIESKGARFKLTHINSIENQLIRAAHVGVGEPNLLPHYDYSILRSESIEMRLNTDVGSLVEGRRLLEYKRPKDKITNRGPLPLKSGLVFSGKVEIVSSGVSATIRSDKFLKLSSGEEYALVIEPELNSKTKMELKSTEKGDPFTGLYPVEPDLDSYGQQKVDGLGNLVFKQLYPKFLTRGGKLAGADQLTFAGVDFPLVSGTYQVRIAKVDKIKIEGSSNYKIKFKYRKGV